LAGDADTVVVGAGVLASICEVELIKAIEDLGKESAEAIGAALGETAYNAEGAFPGERACISTKQRLIADKRCR
jgi:hypothetical protein